MTPFDEVRSACAKTDAIAAAAMDLFDGTSWGTEVDRQRLERLAHLIGAASEAATTALDACDRFAGVLADAARVPADGGW